MKKITFILVCLALAGLGACKQDKEIGAPITIDYEYKLPQVGASQADNDRIAQLYDKYGSYFLYTFDQKDAMWTQAYTGGSAIPMKYVATEGDPKLVGAFLDFLGAAWLQFFPDNFLRKGGIPYRVFLCNRYYLDRGTYPDGSPWQVASNYAFYGKAIIIAGLNETFLNQTSAQKTAWKNTFVAAMANYYSANGITVEPEPTGFYKFTDYVSNPSWMLDGYWNYSYATTPESVEKARRAGFLPSSPSTTANWVNSAYWWGIAKTTDFGYFKTWVWQATDAQIAPYLTNPNYTIIQQKWAWMVNYYKNVVGIDVRKIANTVL